MSPGHQRVSRLRASRYGGQGAAIEPRDRSGALGPHEGACKGVPGTKSPGEK